MSITLVNSIRFRLPALFLLAALLPTLLSVVWSSRLLKQRMEDMFTQRARESAVIVGNIFDQYQQDILLKTRIISQTQAIQTHLLTGQSLELINQLNALYQDLNLQLYDAVLEVYQPNGQLLVAEPRQGRRLTPTAQIQAALRGEIKSVRLFAGEDLLICSTLPVYQASRSQPIGVLAVNFRVSHKLADEIRKIAGNEILILGQSPGWHVLASTLDEHTSDQLMQQWRQQTSGQKRQLPYILSALPEAVSNGHYVLAVAVSVAQMDTMIASVQQVLLIMAGAAFVLALIIAIGLSHNFIAKFDALIQLAGRSGRETHQARGARRVLHESHDEFRELGYTLEAMHQKIEDTLQAQRQLIDKLTIRDTINQVIISSPDNQLLTNVLQVITLHIQARQASIMMLDPETQQLDLRVVYDPHKDLQPVNVHDKISFTPGEGIAGYVVATGEAVLCNHPHQDPRFKPYHFQDLDHRLENLLCLPLKFEQTILGVISLDNKAEGFAPADLEQVQDIADQVAVAIKNADLYKLSITDGLTGLYIRRYFQDQLEQEIKRSQRFHQKLALVMFDIDYFKRFNDTYGHQAGDWVLKKVGALVSGNVREGIDLSARYGGEEFVIIMPETDLEGARQVAERLRLSIEQTAFSYEGHVFRVTISLGCAEYPLQATTREQLIEKADLALYASKHQGRNRVTCYTPHLEQPTTAQS
jgi:diguanylate cyclase (GGDEF)-like protein